MIKCRDWTLKDNTNFFNQRLTRGRARFKHGGMLALLMYPANFSTSYLITSSGAIAKDAALLVPTKALKTGARATPHTAPQPLPVVDIVGQR